MKKRLVSLLLAFSMMLTFLPVGAMAATTITRESLKYTINADGKSVTVSGVLGSPEELTIASSIPDGNGKSYTVTIIGMGAFNKCDTLTEVTLPHTLDEIEDSAFFKCSSLTNVTIPEGVTKIGTNAFYGCSKLTSITIPSTITNMEWAFSGDTALSQVTLTNGIPKISSNAFERCTGLTEIKVPMSVEQICPNAFDGCTGLTSVTLEKGIRTIYSNAFNNCSKLTDVKYNGYKADWEKVTVYKTGNDKLTSNVQYLCDINFDLNGGTVNGSTTVNQQTVYSNEKLGTAKCYQNDQPFVVPSDPVREGYTFLGWYAQDETTPANLEEYIARDNITFTANWTQKEEKVTYTLSLLGGIAKVNGKDTTINDNGDITIEKGATVEVTFDKSILSDAQTFDQWTIKPVSVLNAVDPKAETITFTMPGENVIIEAMTKDASIEEEPNILGTTLIIGTAAAGTAVLAYQTYQLGTEFYLICALPTGTAIPTNRGELAELVWNNAGKPEPAAVLNANATETDKAIAWAVENDLLKAAKNNGETYEATDSVNRTEVIKAWNQVQAFKK